MSEASISVRPAATTALRSAAQEAVRVAIVTNIPAPYRLPMYRLLAAMPGIHLKLFFCSGREPDREWDLEHLEVQQVYLRERVITWRNRFIHANPDVWVELNRFQPDVVVSTGFNPTHLLAFVYARARGLRHIAMTDGTFDSEMKLSFVHRWVRRLVYASSAAYVGASEGSFALYRSYGITDAAMFKSHLCANNAQFSAPPLAERDWDFIFCGRFVPGKLPIFAIHVAAQVAERLGRQVRLLLVGSGELDAPMRHEADLVADRVHAHFAGFARQGELPAHYARAKVSLFPTLDDTWGVVANEACAAGVPVIVSPQAGVAGDLVVEGVNGRVLPLDLATWADAAADLLRDPGLWASLSQRGVEAVGEYTYANAARGLANAIAFACGGPVAPAGHGAHARPPAAWPRVVVLQRRLTHYRLPLFERMREMLANRGIAFELVHGDPTPEERAKGDEGVLPWSQHVPCHYGLGGRLCLQWAWPQVRGASLVIATQENKLLFNHVLALTRRKLPLALWGHGRNFQSRSPNGLRERCKRLLIPHADWWFAYTQTSADVVQARGYAAGRITVLNNTIDTRTLEAHLRGLDGTPDSRLRDSLGLAAGPVALVLGSLYRVKGLEFTLAAARLMREQIPDLQLLVVGDGPDRPWLAQQVRGDAWVQVVGVKAGRAKAECLRVASVMLAPHGLGLVVLDSFLAGVPLVVTASPGHGPEFAYLRDGDNCVVAPATVPGYAAAAVALLGDEPRRRALARSGAEDARELTLERMAERFCDGIASCLAQGRSSRAGVPA